MEYRIHKRRGTEDFVVKIGHEVKSQPNPDGPGYIMTCFIEYESSVFDSYKKAKNYAEKKCNSKSYLIYIQKSL